MIMWMKVTSFLLMLLYEEGGFLHGGWVVQRRKEGLSEFGFQVKKRELECDFGRGLMAVKLGK